MPPIKVKVYGLLPMSKSGYLTVQAVGLVVLLALVFVLFFYVRRPVIPRADQVSLTVRLSIWLVDVLPWLVLGVVPLEGLETWLVLKKFAREEAKQRALAGDIDDKTTLP